MSSHSQQVSPMKGLPIELLEQVVEEILTTKTLADFACTCSTVNSLIERNPLRFYLTDLRFQRLRRSNSEVQRDYPPTLPTLIHAIQYEDLERFKVVFKMFQTSFSRKLVDKWPYDEWGKIISPTPIAASITADRFDVFWHLLSSTNTLTFSDWNACSDHPFYKRAVRMMEEEMGFFPVQVFLSQGVAYQLI
ncbi:hypothetical protein F5Y12DRAFT_758918 [Xylaria sp. FL1777]|nr:hypothetical protein F5Y12DRAFT_758918 [Xylaria sp. FL1777]